MVRLLAFVLRLRRRALRRHRDHLLDVIERYGGLAQKSVIAEWRHKLDETEKTLADVEERLARAER